MKHTHLKRARLPIPPLGLDFNIPSLEYQNMSGKRDSDPRPQPWQGCALPTELFPLITITVKRRRLELPRHNCHYPLKVARLPIPPPLQQLLSTKYLNKVKLDVVFKKIYERKTGLGPATPTLARLCSTNWAISAYFLLFIGAFLWMRVQRYHFFPNYQTFLELFLKKRCILPIFQAKTHLFP